MGMSRRDLPRAAILVAGAVTPLVIRSEESGSEIYPGGVCYLPKGVFYLSRGGCYLSQGVCYSPSGGVLFIPGVCYSP